MCKCLGSSKIVSLTIHCAICVFGISHFLVHAVVVSPCELQ